MGFQFNNTKSGFNYGFNISPSFPWKNASQGGRRPKNIFGIPNFFSKPIFGQTPDIIAAAQFLVVAATVSSVLRVFSRRRTKSRFLWDDVCAVTAAGFLVTNTMIFIEFTYLGNTTSSFSFFGGSSPEEEKERRANIVVGLKLNLAFEVLYLVGMFLVKFSMLFLYDRFARQTSGITSYLRITQGLVAATLVACILSLFLSCRPIRSFWSLTQSDEQCSRRTFLTYASGISNIVTNTLVLAVPVPLLLRAVLTRQQKIGLSILYLFGATVILASALRFTTQLLNVSLPQAMGWSQIELSLALLLACAPMAVKLLHMPLINPKTERKRILKEKSGRITPGPETAALDTPTFVRKLLMERDAIITATAANSSGPQRPPRAADSLDGFSMEEGRAGRDAKNSDYHRLRLVREEVNGQSVWGVRPLSPRMRI